MNTNINWKPNTWYRFFADVTHEGPNTLVSLNVLDVAANVNHFISTIAVGVQGGSFQGSTDTFLEDWSSSGSHKRKFMFSHGKKRNA